MNIWSSLHLPHVQTYQFRRLHASENVPSGLGLIAITRISGIDVEFLSIKAANDMAQECENHRDGSGSNTDTELAICRLRRASFNELMQIASELCDVYIGHTSGKAA